MLLTITDTHTQHNTTHTTETMAEVINLVGSTSTEEHEHESYDTFQVKALALAQSLFGSSGVITLERMRGGSNNRIIGINVDNKPTYILRIPRYPDTVHIEDEAAAFLFVLKHAGIPAPVVVSYDAGDENLIGAPYAVFKVIEGDCLYPHWWKSFSLSEKVKIARQMGRTCRRIVETRNKAAGWPAFSAYEHGVNAPVHIENFKYDAAGPFMGREMVADALWEPHALPAVPVPQFMIGVFETHIRKLPEEVKAGDKLDKHIDTLGRLVQMVKDMDARGVFEGVGYSLYHCDIAPRNIMYYWAADGEAGLTMLDWDEVMFMPTFMACEPPRWLWNEDTENDKHDNPEHSTERFLAFSDEVGKEFIYYSGHPVFKILRQAMEFVILRTVCNRVQQQKADAVLAKWEQWVLDNPKK